MITGRRPRRFEEWLFWSLSIQSCFRFSSSLCKGWKWKLEVETGLPYSIRRIRVRAFSFLLSYTIYPSVDFQTGEALDVIYILACRHEKQAEPNWSARDPFRL